MRDSLLFRLKCFAAHLIASAVIASCCLVLVYLIWHPAPLAQAVGVDDIFLLLLAVDVVLGPLLTMVVAKKNKPSLKTDLLIIVVIQVLALIYGMSRISINRPVYIAFDTFRFELVQAGDVTEQALDEAHSYDQLSWTGPEFVAVKPPANQQERNDRLFKELQTGVAPSMQPVLYEPLANQRDKILAASHPLSMLEAFNEKDQINQVISANPNADRWLPLKAYQHSKVVLINGKSASITSIVDLNPW